MPKKLTALGLFLKPSLSALAGFMLGIHDITKNSPHAYENREYKLSSLYLASGALGVYISAAPIFNIPFFWPALVSSILIATAISTHKSSAVKNWISRCKFSKFEKYRSLENELEAFNFAIGN